MALPEARKLRQATYHFHGLLEPRRKAKHVRNPVISELDVLGLSTCRADTLVESLTSDGIHKTQIFCVSKTLDVCVGELRNRGPDGCHDRNIRVDALLSIAIKEERNQLALGM